MTTVEDTVHAIRAGRPLAEIAVSEAMHRGVLTCPPSAPLVDVARMMSSRRVHCIVVCDNGWKPGTGVWAILSDLDLIAAAGVRSAEEQTAEGSAASPVVQVVPTDTLEHAAQLMIEYATAHLVVVDPGTQHPVGVLSTLDVARAIAR